MDPVTHGLSSYALSRACFPRAPRLAVAAIVLVGTLADLDYLSSLFGPTAFLAAHRTFTHSLAGTLLIAALVAGIYVLLGRRFEAKLVSASTILIATLLAADTRDRKSTRLNSSHVRISYAVFCLKQ